MDPMTNYVVPSPYDAQVPSTSSCTLARPNTPQTPYTPNSRSAYSSTHGSPFRPSNPADPVVRLRESCAARNVQTAQWMDNQYMTGVPSCHNNALQPARPGSVMSGISGMSAMSGMSRMSISNMSQLSISTQLTEVQHFAPMPPYQRSSGASSVENMDPNFLFQIDGKVTALINNMRHPDPNIRRKTMNSVQDMAKRKEFALVNQVRLRELLGQFLQFVYEHTIEQNHTQLLQSIFNIINCRNCISVLMDQQMQHLLFNIVTKYLNPDRPYTAWIVIVFTALLQKQQLTKFRRWMRKNDYFVNRLMLILQSQTEFNKSLAIDSIRMLVHRTTALKESFVRCGGMALLLNFLQTENEEKVLFSSTKNLLTLISTESSDFGKMFVLSRGVQILGNLLSHGSSRLLHVVLQCMSSVGDLKDLASQDISAAIVAVLQLLGAHDPIIASHGTAFLLNVAASSQTNKATMVSSHAPETILSILSTLNGYFMIQLPNIRQLVEAITENSMMCLANMSRAPDEIGQSACLQIARKSGSANILLNVLASGNMECKCRAIMIIYKTTLHFPEFMLLFLETVDDVNHLNLVHIVLRLLWESIMKHDTFMDEEKANRKVLIDRSVKLLVNLMKRDELAEQILQILSVENPLLIIRVSRDGDYGGHCALLAFLDSITSDPRRASLVSHWLGQPDARQMLKWFCENPMQTGQATATHALNIASRFQYQNVPIIE